MKADPDVVITTIYVVIDTICQKMLSTPPQKQKMADAEIVTIAICSALFFNSNHEKALVWLHISGYFPQVLSLSRFNRRVHRMKDFIEYCFESINDFGTTAFQQSSYLAESFCRHQRLTVFGYHIYLIAHHFLLFLDFICNPRREGVLKRGCPNS